MEGWGGWWWRPYALLARRWLEPRLSHIPPTQAYIVLVGIVGDVDRKAGG